GPVARRPRRRLWRPVTPSPPPPGRRPSSGYGPGAGGSRGRPATPADTPPTRPSRPRCRRRPGPRGPDAGGGVRKAAGSPRNRPSRGRPTRPRRPAVPSPGASAPCPGWLATNCEHGSSALTSPTTSRPRPCHLRRRRVAFDELPVAVDCQMVPRLNGSRRPADAQPRHLPGCPEAEDDAVVAAGEVAAAALDLADELLPADLQRQHRAGGVGVGLADEGGPEPVVPVVADVPQQGDRLVGVADHDVGAAVVVQVAEGHAPADPLRPEVRPAAGRNVPEADEGGRRRVAPEVAEEDGPLLVLAGRGGVLGDVPVGDEQVLGPVAVEI